MKKISIILIVIISFYLNSCNLSDNMIELSGGYFYRGEGGKTNDILNHKDDMKSIPANVIDYDYNDNFILAAQRPNERDDPMYENYEYKYGREKIYFWLILNREKLVLGPLSEGEFNNAKKKYKVPEDLNVLKK